MCKFLSAIVTQDGRILSMPEATDSHEDLIKHFKLHERTGAAAHGQKFIRVEFVPKDGKSYDQPDTYELTVDEESTPAWFDAERRASVVASLRKDVEAMILRDGVLEVMLGGCYILSGAAKIVKMVAGKLGSVCGGTVNAVWGGTVNEVCGGTVNAVRGGTVNEVCGGTVNEVWGGTVNEVWGGTVNAVRGGTVNAVWGGTVNEVCGGTVNAVRGGTVNAVRGGTVNEVWGGTVNEVWGGTVTAKPDYSPIVCKEKITKETRWVDGVKQKPRKPAKKK